jgi:hypothetical protein
MYKLNGRDYIIITICFLCVVGIFAFTIWGLTRVDWNVSSESKKVAEELGPATQSTQDNGFNRDAAIYDYMQSGKLDSAIMSDIIGVPQTNVFDK